MTPPALSPSSMRTAMGLDKKVVDGRLRLILAQLGRVALTDDVDDRLLGETLAARCAAL